MNISATCENFNSVIKYSLIEIIHHWIHHQDWHYLNLLHLKNTRQKRALINVIGKFNRFIYGKLDEDDLTDINCRINDNTNKLNSVLKFQKK